MKVKQCQCSYVAFVKTKEQIISNFQKSCFSVVTRMICCLKFIEYVFLYEVGIIFGLDSFFQYSRYEAKKQVSSC